MRKYIDLVESLVMEGVDFHPSVMRQEERDGRMQTIIDYPPDTTRRESKKCRFCDGTGNDYHYDHSDIPPRIVYEPGTKCGYCDGAGKTMEWTYDFPSMRIPHMGISLLCDVLGREYDDYGWVPPEQIPDLKRRLMMVINGNIAAALAQPATDEQNTVVDREGEVPTIRRGARMIGPGIDENQVRRGAQALLDIVDWAQKHGCGVSWA